MNRTSRSKSIATRDRPVSKYAERRPCALVAFRLGEGQWCSGADRPIAFSGRATVATMMLNFAARTTQPGKRKVRLTREKDVTQALLSDHLVELRKRPNDIFAIETALKAQWSSGDIRGAVKLIRRAMRLNPMEPEYFLMRGLLRQSIGMYSEAISDFEMTFRIARTEELRAKALQALRALEDWQMTLLQLLLDEDGKLRHEFSLNPVEAVERRGFRFSKEGSGLLIAVSHGHGLLQHDRPLTGSC